VGFRVVEVDCQSEKTAYPTGLDAGMAAEWAIARGLPGRWPYLCRWCALWHLTSREPGLPAHIDHHAR